MKIAIIADCHLNSSHPERKNALENIFSEVQKQGLSSLIIAGDLFDKEQQNYYSEFDEIAKKFSDINIYLIGGNHDSNISSRFFTASNLNLRVISTPEIINLDNLKFLFIPYTPSKSMDEIIVSKSGDLKNHQWVLISHGDYLSSKYESNPYEQGIYMPLTSMIIERYSPIKVFLGHIHKSLVIGKVYYPGSIFPIDITEKGKRKIIVFDTTTYEAKFVEVKTSRIYFDETILTYPGDDELSRIEKELIKMINSWDLSQDELRNVILQLKVIGCSADKKALSEKIKEILSQKGINYYKEPDLTEVLVSDAGSAFDDRLQIFKEIKGKLVDLKLTELSEGKIELKDIEEEVLRLIFEK